MGLLSQYDECFSSECYEDLTTSLSLVPKKLIEEKNRLMEKFFEKFRKNDKTRRKMFLKWISLKLGDHPPIKFFKRQYFASSYDSVPNNFHY
jgi:hypothetical protein